MASPKDDLTAEYVRSLFWYDAETGFLYRRPIGRLNFDVRWANKPAGGKNRGYLTVRIYGSAYYVHRLIWLLVHGKWPTEQIDHINEIKDDNRLCNLREASPSLNRVNVTYNGKGRYLKGSRPKTSKRWESYIMIKGRNKYLGIFASELEAHLAHILKAKQLYGEFAKSPIANS
jgi:hypothetical protein